MLTVRRLNMDSSWALAWAGRSMIIDPWLVGSEVDGFSWFNEQWHATPPVSIDALEPYQSIIISQAYSDHCHRATLEVLHPVSLIVTPSSAKRVRKEMPGSELRILPEVTSGHWLDEGMLKLAYLDPGRVIDPIYNGVVIRNNDQVVIYFPHGFTLKPNQLEALQRYDTVLLITSFSRFKLPAFLGGAVNPGKENALRLIAALNPIKVVHTHDENKHAKGLVKRIAQVEYPDPQQLVSTLAGRFVYLQYEPLNI